MRVRNLIILIALIVFLLLVLHGDNRVENYEVETYIVKPGDTAWNIAERYNIANKDIRDLVYFIGIDNDIKPGYLYPGQEIKVRIYEKR